jgi:hypothetical protein
MVKTFLSLLSGHASYCYISSELCDIMIVVCWQDRRGNRLEIAVAMNKGCHDVGLRKQHLGYHNSWDCWYFILCIALC